MDRRTFFKGLAGLLTLPFLPEISEAPKISYYGNSVHIDDYITDPDAWFIKDYANHKSSILFVRRESEEMAHRSLARTEECR